MAFTAKEKEIITIARSNGMLDTEELANFLAQLSVESGNFKRTDESFRYTKGITQVRNAVYSMKNVPDDILTDAVNKANKGDPVDLADLMYNSQYRKNRMGNTDKGDGYKYRGRGYIQITGKDNYREQTNYFGKSMGVDFVKDPDLLTKAPYDSLSALAYWYARVSTRNRVSVKGARQDINGGTNGLNEAEKYFIKYKKDFIELGSDINKLLDNKYKNSNIITMRV